MDDKTLFACLKHLLTRSNKVKTFMVLGNDEQELIEFKSYSILRTLLTLHRGVTPTTHSSTGLLYI
jgi:hypothetical protein